MFISSIVGANVKAYFTVDIYSPSGLTTLSHEDMKTVIRSFKIEEKERELITGEIEIIDSDGGLYEKLLRFGTKMDIEWGLQNYDPSWWFDVESDEIKGFTPRKLKVHVINCPVKGADGIVTYNVSFRQSQVNQYLPLSYSYTSGTVGQVLQKIADRLKAKLTVSFSRENEQLTTKNPLIQSNITDVAFLRHIAWRYNCKCVMQSDYKGTMHIWFTEYSGQASDLYTFDRGLSGAVHYFDYGTMESNVISFGFNSNANSANGSNLSYQTGPDGKTQLVVRANGQESASVWELNPAAVQAALRRGTFSDQAALMRQILSAGESDLFSGQNLIPTYFVRKVNTTAPEGYGHTGEMNVVFNPNYQVGDMAFIGSDNTAIPAKFRTQKTAGRIQSKTLWRIVELTTSITESGPEQTVKVAR